MLPIPGRAQEAEERGHVVLLREQEKTPQRRAPGVKGAPVSRYRREQERDPLLAN